MNTSPATVLIMAGGTGGHIFPGLALAEALAARNVMVRWLGAAGAMECRQVPAHGIPLDAIRIAGVRGKGLAGWLRLPFLLARAVREAWSVMRRCRPVCAVSFGGYAAGPGGIAAWLRGVPLVVHEQNRVPGMTNRFLAGRADRVFQAFEGTFPASTGAETCGNPVRRDFVRLPPPAARFSERSGPLRLLVTGGSQGAAALNRLLPGAMGRLEPGQRPEIRHQAGRGAQEEVSAAYRAVGVEARVTEFIDDMAGAFGWADLVVCRAGALTVSELAVAGVGALLVPFPHAVDDHQSRNAEVLSAAGAALILPEASLDERSLAGILCETLADRGQLLQMAEAARSVGVDDAAERIARHCVSYLPASQGREVSDA